MGVVHACGGGQMKRRTSNDRYNGAKPTGHGESRQGGSSRKERQAEAGREAGRWAQGGVDGSGAEKGGEVVEWGVFPQQKVQNVINARLPQITCVCMFCVKERSKGVQ